MIGGQTIHSPMSVLQAYLRNPKTQRILSRKPGQEGFSLIELVVVVAVLAILAAIAIPYFTALSDDARVNTSKSILTSMYKECEYNKIRTGTASRGTGQTNGNPSGVTWNTLATGTTCTAAATATMTVGSTSCVIILDLSDGSQSHTGASDASNWPATAADC